MEAKVIDLKEGEKCFINQDTVGFPIEGPVKIIVLKVESSLPNDSTYDKYVEGMQEPKDEI